MDSDPNVRSSKFKSRRLTIFVLLIIGVMLFAYIVYLYLTKFNQNSSSFGSLSVPSYIATSDGTEILVTETGTKYTHGNIQSYVNGIIVIANSGASQEINLFSDTNKQVYLYTVNTSYGDPTALTPEIITNPSDFNFAVGDYVSIYFADTYISLFIRE